MSKKPSTRRRSSHNTRRMASYAHGHSSFHTHVQHFPDMLRHVKRGYIIGAIIVLALYVWGFYYFFVGPTGFRWRALYGDIKYPKGYEIHGIDVSHYQGNIDWHRLKTNALADGTPLRFVFIKGTEGSTQLDTNFKQNFKSAREYGFIRGVYHFWGNKSSARQQAYHFLDEVKLEDGDLPPVLDIEYIPEGTKIEDFQRNVLTWLHVVEDRYHVKPIIYTYHKFKQQYLSAPVFDDYPYWIAHYYVEKIAYRGQWKFWQYTDAGQLPGITGAVDLNVYNGSYYDLLQLTIGRQKDNNTSKSK